MFNLTYKTLDLQFLVYNLSNTLTYKKAISIAENTCNSNCKNTIVILVTDENVSKKHDNFKIHTVTSSKEVFNYIDAMERQYKLAKHLRF